MSIVSKYLLWLWIIIMPFRGSSQNTNSVDSIPAGVKEYMEIFVQAFNSGDTARLEAFIGQSHHAKVLEQVSAKQLLYRLNYVYYQYGPVEARIYKRLSKTTAIVWARARLTKAWVGFQFFFTETPPHKVTTIGVDRGQLPPKEELLTGAYDDTELKADISAIMNGLKNSAFFSGSAAVFHNGKLLLSKTTGYSDRQRKIKNSKNSLFPIASTSKIFTAIAIMQLKEKGLLKITDLLSKFIPEYPGNIANKATVYHLLTHTSGIELDEIPEFNNSEAATIKEMTDLQIKYIPGVKELADYKLTGEFNYTNEGYVLLARIIEVVSGMSYWEYIEKHILIPCGMKNTRPRHKATGLVVKGYTNRNPNNGSYISATPTERILGGNSIASPAGGLVSTVEDLVKFAKAFVSGKLITKGSVQEMCTAHIEETKGVGYGYGIRIYNTPSGICWSHAGDILGFNSRLDIYPESGYIVAALTNQDQAANNMADYIREILPK